MRDDTAGEVGGNRVAERKRRPRLIRSLIALALGLTTIVTLSQSSPAIAAPVFYTSAQNSERISVIGDSVMAGIRWYGTWSPLQVYNYTVDVESCRRTTGASCRGREGYQPDNTVQAMRRLRGSLGSVVVIGTGYDDAGWTFDESVDAVMAEAAAQGIEIVVWATMRTADVSYVGPTYRSNQTTFRDNNRILLAKQSQYGGRLRVADWATYSAGRSDWVEWDGIHLTRTGSYAMAQFIANQSKSALRMAKLPSSPHLSATSLGANQVRLDWTTPERSGATPILDYRYQYSTNGGATWTTGVAGPASARSTVVSGLTNNTTYTFRIAARNSLSWSPTSNRVSVRTRLTGPSTPRLAARSVGANQVVLSWTGSAYTGGSPILDYRYQYSTNGGATWTTGVAGAPSARSTVVSGLRNNTTYMFRIAARNRVAWSVTSNRVNVTTRLTGPSTPRLWTRVAGPNQVALYWTGSAYTGGSPILDYRYQYSTNGGATWTTGVAGPPSARSTVVGGLAGNTTYMFRIAARNAVAWSVTSNRVNVTTRVTGPSTPTLSATAVSPNQVRLNWTGSTYTGGSPILDYRYQYSTNGGASWTTGVAGPPSARSTVVGGLAGNSTYMFRIAARNAVAWSVTSNRVNVTTRVTGPSTPTLSATAVSPNQVRLNWTGSTYTGGSPILDYRYQYSTNGGASWTTGVAGPPSARSTVVGGLAGNTTYMFRIAARNAVAWSVTSNRVNVRTPAPSAAIAVSSAATDETASEPTTTTSTTSTTAPSTTTPPQPIAGVVWIDGNRDGIRDEGSEATLAGVEVRLRAVHGDVVAETVTDSVGRYEFAPEFAAAVEFVLPVGYEPTTVDVGGDDLVDSDASVSDVVATAGERVVRVDVAEQLERSSVDIGLVVIAVVPTTPSETPTDSSQPTTSAPAGTPTTVETTETTEVPTTVQTTDAPTTPAPTVPETSPPTTSPEFLDSTDPSSTSAVTTSLP